MGSGEGKINFEEFSQWFLPIFNDKNGASEFMQELDAYPDWANWLIENFRWYDTDRSGSISKDEFAKLVADYPFEKAPDWTEVDADGDTNIELNEFMAWAWKHTAAFESTA